jgi:hypothetical protein
VQICSRCERVKYGGEHENHQLHWCADGLNPAFKDAPFPQPRDVFPTSRGGHGKSLNFATLLREFDSILQLVHRNTQQDEVTILSEQQQNFVAFLTPRLAQDSLGRTVMALDRFELTAQQERDTVMHDGKKCLLIAPAPEPQT